MRTYSLLLVGTLVATQSLIDARLFANEESAREHRDRDSSKSRERRRRDRDRPDQRRRDQRPREGTDEPGERPGRTPSSRELQEAIDAELRDVARALRRLDQSYSYGGFRRGNHAWVAGSSFLDRRARTENPARVENRVVFSWRSGRELDGERRGDCRFGRDGELRLSDGSLVVRRSLEPLVRACRATNELRLEADFVPASKRARGPARIVSLSTDANARNFTLGQDGNRLVLRLRTTETGLNGTEPEVSLARLEPGERHRVVITYRPGRLVFRLNGERVLESGSIEGTFENWSPQTLVLGDEVTGDRDWDGVLHGFSISSRVADER